MRDCARSGPLYHQDNTLAGILFIISAPSGSGKSTLVNQLRSLVTDLDFSVSYTTRAPRRSEQQDREYHYISRAKFRGDGRPGRISGVGLGLRQLLRYRLAAHSPTPRQQARICCSTSTCREPAQVREKMPDAVSIFLLPPNPEILAQRLRERSRQGRQPADEEEIARRLAKARGEIENYRQYRYILVNDILDDAVEALTAIVITERARRHGAPPDPETARMMQLADKCRQTNATDRVYTVLCLVRPARHARHPRLKVRRQTLTGGNMTPEHGLDSNFRYVVMAARRARQLQNGSQPLIDSRSNKACRVAQEEIAAGKVKAAAQPRVEMVDEVLRTRTPSKTGDS